MRKASAICCAFGNSGVTADEEQPQHVIPLVRHIEPLGERCLVIELHYGAIRRRRARFTKEDIRKENI